MRTPVAQSLARTLMRAAVLTPLFLIPACASAGKRFEQGRELEEAGRPADAARRYIQALQKDPSLQDARLRLQETGDRAAADALREAAFLDQGGRSGDAADVLLRLDELRGEASAVGVQLALPADYGALRRATFDRAIAQSVEEANEAAARGSFGDALGWLERASGRWQPTAAQRTELERARYDANLAWAQADLASGRYRSAYDRAERALSVFGGAGPRTSQAAELRAEALRRGTVRVAVLPVTAEGRTRRRLPEDFFPTLDDRLEESAWRRLPLFVDVVDPLVVARETRRHGGGRPVLSVFDGERIGRALDADVVVLAEVDSVAVRETDVTETRKAAKTKEGVDTAYVEREGRQEVRAQVRWTLVEVETRRAIDRGTVSATGNAAFRRARYAGDWRTLQIPLGDRVLFETQDERYRDSREVLRELVDGISDRFERAVLDRVVHMIQ